MKKYHQLSRNGRYIIAEKNKAGLSIKTIAEHLNVHFSTIYREFKRNSTSEGYHPEIAEAKYRLRHKHRLKFYQKKEVLTDMIEWYLRRNDPHYSPEALSHYLKSLGIKAPCFKTFYNMIWACKRLGLSNIYKYLHHHRWRYRPRGHVKSHSKIKNRRDIDERPKVVEKREKLVDSESDLMYFQGRAILTLVEQKRRFAITSHIVNTCAQTVNNEISRIITESRFCHGKVAKKLRFESIKFDNGSEFEHVFELENEFKLKTYFAKPVSPYQRGSNKNFKGLLRYYLPRKITQLTQEISLFDATNQINSRPRKILGWQSAIEVLMRC